MYQGQRDIKVNNRQANVGRSYIGYITGLSIHFFFLGDYQ